MLQCFANQNTHVYHQTVNIVVFYLKIIKIPTQMGEHSCNRTQLSLKQKEGIARMNNTERLSEFELIKSKHYNGALYGNNLKKNTRETFQSITKIIS